MDSQDFDIVNKYPHKTLYTVKVLNSGVVYGFKDEETAKAFCNSVSVPVSLRGPIYQ